MDAEGHPGVLRRRGQGAPRASRSRSPSRSRSAPARPSWSTTSASSTRSPRPASSSSSARTTRAGRLQGSDSGPGHPGGRVAAGRGPGSVQLYRLGRHIDRAGRTSIMRRAAWGQGMAGSARLALALLAAAAGCAGPRAFGAADRAGVVAVLERQRQARNRGDLDGYMAGYAATADLVFTSGGRIRRRLRRDPRQLREALPRRPRRHGPARVRDPGRAAGRRRWRRGPGPLAPARHAQPGQRVFSVVLDVAPRAGASSTTTRRRIRPRP